MIKFNGKNHDLGGGMLVSRVLPNINKRALGPFVFFDHMGPMSEDASQPFDVRPHPHIGLATLTYLFEGRIVHRDSTGAVATIMPGEVNWMTAGKGISHSERTHDDDKGIIRKLHGLQFWIALPEKDEEIDPSFIHYEKNLIPFFKNEQISLKLIAGSFQDLVSPVITSSPLILAEVKALKETSLNLSELSFEVGLYVVSGSILVGEEKITDRQMIILTPENLNKIKLNNDSHLVIIGGEALESPRYLWWNFVSSKKERIEVAKKEWKEGTFPMVPGEVEFIPLPE